MEKFSALIKHQKQLLQSDLKTILSDRRHLEFSTIETAGWLFDYSKHYFTAETIELFSQWTKDCSVSNKQKSLFSGEIVNVSEKQPALHWLLRCPQEWSDPSSLITKQAFEQIQSLRQRIHQLAEKISTSEYTDVVSIGIGGSHLGPSMIYQAFQNPSSKIRCHFISNLDPREFEKTVKNLDPKRTLFILVSKSFTTEETLENARKAREWLEKGNVRNSKHWFAVTAKPEKAKAWGVESDHIFPMWNWLVGRYSVWSAVSLSLYLSLGAKALEEFLAGAHEMDQHVMQTSWPLNTALFAAVLDVWYGTYWNWNSQAIIPYSSQLSLLPDYIQQLWMESLGKRVSEFGTSLQIPTGRILWGGVGTNSQHSFHQLLMQGTARIPVDFIVPLSDDSGNFELRRRLVAHAMSQSQAMMQGWNDESIKEHFVKQNKSQPLSEIIPHMIIPGGNPNTFMMCEQLNLKNLGALLAFYEHRVFYQSVLLGINAFDQWGVEYGKQMVNQVDELLKTQGAEINNIDPATSLLIQYYWSKKS